MRNLDIFDNTLYIFSSGLSCLYNDNISFSKCFQVICNPIIHNLNTSNCYSTSCALVPHATIQSFCAVTCTHSVPIFYATLLGNVFDHCDSVSGNNFGIFPRNHVFGITDTCSDKADFPPSLKLKQVFDVLSSV